MFSAALQLRNRVGNISRLGTSPGSCDGTVASARRNAVKHLLLAVLALATVLLALVRTVASAKTANCSCLLWFKMLHSVGPNG